GLSAELAAVGPRPAQTGGPLCRPAAGAQAHLSAALRHQRLEPPPVLAGALAACPSPLSRLGAAGAQDLSGPRLWPRPGWRRGTLVAADQAPGIGQIGSAGKSNGMEVRPAGLGA